MYVVATDSTFAVSTYIFYCPDGRFGCVVENWNWFRAHEWATYLDDDVPMGHQQGKIQWPETHYVLHMSG